MRNLKEIYKPVSAELALVEEGIRTQMRVLVGTHRRVDKIVRHFFELPGQRLRPALVVFSARAAQAGRAAPSSRVSSEELALLGVFAEYIHSASLIHDDIVDDASERRGRTCLHARFGDKIAVMAGDMLYSHAFRMLIENFDVNIMKIFSQCVQRMCRGQINEFVPGCGFKRYLNIIEDKTAVFMSACCRAGAALVSKDPDEHVARALGGFGLNLGMIYQMADDLTDADAPVPLMGDLRKKLAVALNRRAASARRCLEAVRGSVYKESLSGMLEYIMQRHEGIKKSERNVVVARLKSPKRF